MVLYKALYDYNSEEINDLYFETNDIIEYLSQTSTSWYKGKNLMSGKIGLFPYNFVSKIDMSEDEDKLYVATETCDTYVRGDILVAIEVQDCDIIGHLLTDGDKVPSYFPIKNLIKVKENPVTFTFVKCVANCDSNGDINQLHFFLGDTIWMVRRIDDNFGEGIISGRKGVFPLQSVAIDDSSSTKRKESDDEKTPSIDRKNRWIALFDYRSENNSDLRFVHGEKLKFLDRIDNNWLLMQNESGRVGMAPCNFVRNISINERPQNREANGSGGEGPGSKEARGGGGTNMPLQPIINELSNHQKNRISYCDLKRESMKEAVIEEVSAGDTDENLCEDEQNRFHIEGKIDSETEETVDSLTDEFEQRERRVKNDMEVLLDDITSIRNTLSRQDCDQDQYMQIMANNLSFLKEEYKERQKQLAFIKQQKESILNGTMRDFDESDYCTLKCTEDIGKKYLTRTKVIEEILETEVKFINDLKLTLKIFNQSEMKCKISEQDYHSIFGDLEAVISVSDAFHTDLSAAVDNSGVDVAIGSIFLKFLNSFESVYKEYCVNYDRKLELINKKPKSEEIGDFIKEGLKKMNENGTIIACIDGMLVKPLQRFLKYPLFMKTIIENTDEEHIDISDLRSALIEFERIAKKINEKKRFEELRTEIFERNGQWHQKTLHALQKVPKRLLVASLYGSQRDDDLEYRQAVLKFKNLKKCVSFFIETVIILRDNLKEVLMLYSSINEDLTQIASSTLGSQLHQYIAVCKDGESNYYRKYLSVLEGWVISPLTKLLELFSGPKILIKKRQSKFLDYLGMKQKMEVKEVTRVQADRLEELKNQYLAINNTLKEELPILTSKSSVIFNECLANYLQMTTSIQQSSIESLRTVIGDEEESAEDEQRSCKNKQTEFLNQLHKKMLTYNSRNDVHRVELSPTNPRRCRSDSVSRTEYYCQTEEDIMNLKIKFVSNNLAYVKKDFIPTKPHQIYVSMGNLVGIVKRCDPQGHASSWLIEVCHKRVGFVPRSYLNPTPCIDHRHSLVNTTLTRSTNVDKRYSLSDSPSGSDLIHFSPNNATVRSVSLTEQPPTYDIRIALFDFKSTGQTDISMRKSDQLRLIEGHDNSGNTSWSLVKNLRTDAHGYVPTNYMSSDPRKPS